MHKIIFDLVLRTLATIILASAFYGMIIPFLISYPSDLTVLFGIILGTFGTAFALKAIFSYMQKTIKKLKNEKF